MCQAAHDDSIVLTLLDLPNKGMTRGVLVPGWSQLNRLHPFSETVCDGHTCSSLSFLPVSRGSRGSGGGGDVAPSPRKFVACVGHGLKNTRVALAELATAPGR